MKANLGLPRHQYLAYNEIINNLSYSHKHAMWGDLIHKESLNDNTPSQDYDYYCMYMATDLI